jgi:organic radical activating enzyme
MNLVQIQSEAKRPRQEAQKIAPPGPNDLVKSCRYMETGSCFQEEGVRCCVHGDIYSPVLITADEMRNGVSYDLVVQRRREHFERVNGLREGPTGMCPSCGHLKEKKFKDVNFEYLGGEHLPGGMNIQHYTKCNERCTYCQFTVDDNFVGPQYEILGYLDEFRKNGKLRGGNWVDFSGGEPATLKNFDEILNYFLSNNLGTVVVYSNSTVYKQSIYDALKKNQIILTTSLDTGLPSTYKELRGLDFYSKVVTNLIRYRNSGTSGLWLKYVICDTNRTEDDLWSFIMAVLAIKPNRVMISPHFRYGDEHIEDETVAFAAKLWYLLEKHYGFTPGDYTTAFKGAKWDKYRTDLARALESMKAKKPFGVEDKLRERGTIRGVINRMILARDRALHSDLRARLLPDGSARLTMARRVWAKTVGRIAFLRA